MVWAHVISTYNFDISLHFYNVVINAVGMNHLCPRTPLLLSNHCCLSFFQVSTLKWWWITALKFLHPWFEFFQSKKLVLLEMAHHLPHFHLKYFCNYSGLGNVLPVMILKGFSLSFSLQMNQNISLFLLCIITVPGTKKLIYCFSSPKHLHRFITMGVLSINISTCTVFMQGRSVLLSNTCSLFSTTVSIWHTW